MKAFLFIGKYVPQVSWKACTLLCDLFSREWIVRIPTELFGITERMETNIWLDEQTKEFPLYTYYEILKLKSLNSSAKNQAFIT